MGSSFLPTGLFAILQRLAWSSPALLAYLTGITLALVYWRRCPVPSAIVLIAASVLFLALVGSQCLWGYVLAGGSIGSRDWLLSAVSFCSGLIHAVGVITILIAVFIGRKAPVVESPIS